MVVEDGGVFGVGAGRVVAEPLQRVAGAGPALLEGRAR